MNGNALAADIAWGFTTGTGSTSTIYVSDLTWASAVNGWGPVEKDRSNGEEGAGDGLPMVVNVRNGAPPFNLFANGAPFEQSAFTRQGMWTPDGPGYVTVSVVDAKGRSDQVKVFLD